LKMCLFGFFCLNCFTFLTQFFNEKNQLENFMNL